RQRNGMYHRSGVMDPEAGAALKTAVDALAKRLGQDDSRTPKQRRVDALSEIVHKGLDEGKLPERNGARPHVNVNTTLEALKGELGAAASELEPGMPISSKTVQRLACDGTLSRVLKADSVVVDIGRGREPSRRPCTGPSSPAIGAAHGRAASGRSTGRLPITSSSGRGVDRPTLAT